MIAKLPGFCCFCRKPIEPGRDTYEVETRRNWHEACRENQPASPEQFAIADRLGFVKHNDGAIEVKDPARLSGNRPLRQVHEADDGPAARRSESAAPGRDRLLWE
jgi:hypothetical protein